MIKYLSNVVWEVHGIDAYKLALDLMSLVLSERFRAICIRQLILFPNVDLHAVQLEIQQLNHNNHIRA